MSCHPHDTSIGDGGMGNDAKIQHYFELANLVCTKTLTITKTDLIYHVPLIGRHKKKLPTVVGR